MAVVGDQEDVALCGWQGAPAGGPVFALGAFPERPDVRFVAHPEGAAPPAERIVAPAGEGLWRRAPWPVADELFDLEPPADPSAVLVVAGPEVAGELRDNGATVAEAERLTLANLRAAGVVVLMGRDGAFPALGSCVLAARRVLVCGATEATFGMQADIEFLLARTAGEAVARADLARVHPPATGLMRVLGARAAREHRASVVYARLAAELG